MTTTIKKKQGKKKIFVFDTSVILFDHQAFYSFQDNDIVIPITVLEELDNFKKGNGTIHFEARQFARIMDKLSEKNPLSDWVSIDRKGAGKVKVVFDERTKNSKRDATHIFGEAKNDHKILNVALRIQEDYPETPVIFVTKDINLRIKAKSLGIQAEDYKTGKVAHEQLNFSGKTVVDNVAEEVIQSLYSEGFCELDALKLGVTPPANHYFILKNGKASVLAYYNPVSGRIERVDKVSTSRIMPRNAEQTFALHALLNPDIKLISISGIAGTGKTLLALAAAWAQRKHYKQIFLARPIVPLNNRDIGFLPGNAQDKITPYMTPLYDNLKFIRDQYGDNDPEAKAITTALEEEKILISPLAYIRGRSLSNIYFIVDEAQNLTPLEVKTIITRAGEGTKIVFTGDIYQIDTPYLDTQSNGLSYMIDRIKSDHLYAHIRLEKGERSELANLATELL
ncbi:MAG: PhoH family protein [Bacteroidales bacterium]|jgi:PhoH-like ATPase|nr:PhoH family protein [Bacteroidales bacterium]